MARVRHKKSLLSPTWKRRLLRSSSVVLLAVAWEWGARMHFVSDFLLPSLSSVLERLWDDVISGDIPVALGLTMARDLRRLLDGGGRRRHHRRDHRAAARWCAGSSIRSSRSAIRCRRSPSCRSSSCGSASSTGRRSRWSRSPRSSRSLSRPGPRRRMSTNTSSGRRRASASTAARCSGRSSCPRPCRRSSPGLQIALPISLIVVIICEMTMGGEGLGGSMMTSMRFADSPGVFLRHRRDRHCRLGAGQG